MIVAMGCFDVFVIMAPGRPTGTVPTHHVFPASRKALVAFGLQLVCPRLLCELDPRLGGSVEFCITTSYSNGSSDFTCNIMQIT
jgi:hypothetical protein